MTTVAVESIDTDEPVLRHCTQHQGWLIHRWYVFEVLASHRRVCTGVTVACTHCDSIYDRPKARA